MKRNIILALVSCLAFQAQAQVSFSEKKHSHDIFAAKAGQQGNFSYTYIPYKEWLASYSGKYFPMSIDPVLEGMAKGGVPNPPIQGVNASDYYDQAAEFAEVVNFKNGNGRLTFDLGETTAQEAFEDKRNTTHVVENLISAVVDLPLSEMGLDAESAKKIPEMVDLDHYHFQIPGSFVQDTLEQGHIALGALEVNKSYVLSAFDLRDYGCAFLKDSVRDYFSKNAEAQQLQNETIYMISDMKYNNSADLAQAEKYFGKRPDALVTQDVIYASHLIRGARSYFAFFAEGDKTRVVLLSNIAMGSKFFTGAKGAVIRQSLLDGVGSGISGAILDAKDGLSGLAGLISGATQDVNEKNSCDRGLALGLIGFSQSMLNEFFYFATEY